MSEKTRIETVITGAARQLSDNLTPDKLLPPHVQVAVTAFASTLPERLKPLFADFCGVLYDATVKGTAGAILNALGPDGVINAAITQIKTLRSEGASDVA